MVWQRYKGTSRINEASKLRLRSRTLSSFLLYWLKSSMRKIYIIPLVREIKKSHEKRRGENFKPMLQCTIPTMAQAPLFMLYTSFQVVFRPVSCIVVIIILQIRNWDSKRLSDLFGTTLPANDETVMDI